MKMTVDGIKREIKKGSLRETAEQLYGSELPFSERILLAYADGRLRELRNPAEEGTDVRFLNIGSKEGYDTYRRSAVMLLLAAYHRLFGEAVSQVNLHFALGNGFYFTFGNDVPDVSSAVLRLKEEMRRMTEEAIPFTKYALPTYEARRRFSAAGMSDKEKLFRTRVTSRVNVYSLDGYEDYYYGYMVPDTSYITVFDLVPMREGAALNLPPKKPPYELAEIAVSEKLIDVQLEGEEWAERQGISTVGDLNEKVIFGGAPETLLISEAMQEGRIADIAAQISRRDGVKFVMIAGPSSSGKTTFSQRLCTQLSAHGMVPHYIGTDNYFVNREEMPTGPDGKKDFEGLGAVDVRQFNEDMSALLAGERVEMPTFDFVEGRRVYKGDYLELLDGELLVIEGIHCLNEKLSSSLPKASKFRIYISALTQLNIDLHNRVPASDGRLLRRIVRDYRTRGYSAAQTIAMWDAVRAGESTNIFPYQDEADVVFNSALPYEIAVLKTYAQPLLFQVGEEDPAYQEAKRLLKFLDYFIAIPADGIPGNSILREFIGGGCFRL